MQAEAAILAPGRTLCHAPGTSKKRLFETIARLISEDQPSLAYDDVLDHLIAREKLGSTGLGGGIAIPHCRIGNCERALGTLVSVEEPIDFDAPDDQAVDLLFVLLVPEEATQEHLDTLARIARVLSQSEFCQQLRAAGNSEALYALAAEQGL